MKIYDIRLVAVISAAHIDARPRPVQSLGQSIDRLYQAYVSRRPAFLIPSSLTVEAEDTNPLEQYSTRELAEELFRRIAN